MRAEDIKPGLILKLVDEAGLIKQYNSAGVIDKFCEDFKFGVKTFDAKGYIGFFRKDQEIDIKIIDGYTYGHYWSPDKVTICKFVEIDNENNIINIIPIKSRLELIID